MLISALSNNANFATVRNATDRLFYLGHRVTQIVDIKSPLFLTLLKASSAALAVIVAAVVLYALYQRWNKVVVVSPVNNPLPPSVTPIQTKATETAVSSPKQEVIGSKMQEMTQSHEYHKGYLTRIEEYLNQIPAKIDTDSVYKLKYIDELLEEIAPTIALFNEEVQGMSEKTEVYFIVESKLALCELYTAVRKKFTNKLKGSEATFIGVARGYAQKVDKMDPHGKAYIANFLNFIQKHFGDKSLQKFLKENSAIASCAAISVPVGIQNQGNSCWMNACIQSIFSSKAFSDRLHISPKTNELLTSLRTLRECMVQGSNPQLLGEVSANIRLAVFGGSVQDYNKNDLYAFQDPGPLYALLLEKLEMEYEMTLTRIAKGIENEKPETEKQTLFPITTSNKPLQEAIDTLANGIETDNKYYVEGKGEANGSIEKLSFKGTPPPVLIFRVKENYGVPQVEEAASSWLGSLFNLFDSITSSSEAGGQVIKENDLMLDLSKLIASDAVKTPCRYRLVGVAKNISQIHYVAYGLRGTEWNLFDDANVTKISSIVGQRGHYLVYEKMTESSS